MLERRSFLAWCAGACALGASLAGCSFGFEAGMSKPATSDPVKVRIAAIKGPTAMGLVRFMDEVDHQNLKDNDYEFQLVASPQELIPLLSKNEIDIACLPAHTAAVLAQKMQGALQVVQINTLGVLSVCAADTTITDLTDLKGKTIYMSGKGSTPEFTVRFLLKKAGLNPDVDVSFEWKSEHAECVAALTQHPEAAAVLPQPFATAARLKNPAIAERINLDEVFTQTADREGSPARMVTGVTVVRKEFLSKHPEAVKAAFEHYSASVAFVQQARKEAAILIGSYDIVPEKVAFEALPQCKISDIKGKEMTERLSAYYKILFDENPESLSGKLPSDDFYVSL